jgi:RNA polymerase sigma-70 factor (ECF subfamily)
MTQTAVATRVDEHGLVGRARTGEAAALDSLVTRHHAAVYEVTFRILGDADAAADAAQDAFVKALGALDGFRGEASFKTWLLRIAANVATSAGRKTTRRREVALEAAPEPASERSNPEREAVVRLEADRVTAALAELPEKQRLAVTLRIHQDLSHREIGEVIGSSEGAARVNYHLGIKRLRELLT